MDAGYGPDSVGQWASTEFVEEQFSFLWSIKNYADVHSGTSDDDKIRSPIFQGGPKSCHKWQLHVYPKKKSEGTEYFAVYLILSEFGDGDGDTTTRRKVKARFQISLLDPEFRPRKQIGGRTMDVHQFEKVNDWGYGEFLRSADMTNRSEGFLQDYTLRIHCRVWIFGDLRHRFQPGGYALNIPVGEVMSCAYGRPSTNFQEFFLDSKFADLALSTLTKTFMVHKVILSARSSVFCAMLSAKMLESTNNTIEIPDFEEDVVKAMLEYIYTGETSDLNEKAADLLQIAEKYDLGGLKYGCELAIARNLSVENAVDVLTLAHLHIASTLKGKVMDFINRNKDAVKKTSSFRNLAGSNANAAILMDLYSLQ